jgi:DNA replication protein DnaC
MEPTTDIAASSKTSPSDPVQAGIDAQRAREKLRADAEEARRRGEERRRSEWLNDPLRAGARLAGVKTDGLSNDEIKAKLAELQELQNAQRARQQAEEAQRAPYREREERDRREQFAADLFKKSACPERHEINLDLVDAQNTEWLKVRDLLCTKAGYANGFLDVLLGLRGVGKTQLCVSVIDACCKRLMTCRYVKALDLFRDFRRAYAQVARGDNSEREDEIVAKWAAYDLLVIDETHERGETRWEQNTLVNLLDLRYDARRCTILIANLTKEDFEKVMGDSIKDRIRETGQAITCDWPSYRKPGKWKQEGADVRIGSGWERMRRERV